MLNIVGKQGKPTKKAAFIDTKRKTICLLAYWWLHCSYQQI